MNTTTKTTISTIQPYLFFEGRCEEAIEFYKRAVGASVEMMMRYKESPEPPQGGECGPVPGDKIMHAQIKIGNSIVMLSDGRCQGNPTFQGFSLSVTAANEAEAKKYFAALSEGGKILMPLGKTFFSPSFGMTGDRFGVMWMVIVHP